MPGKIDHIKTASLDIHLETGYMVDFKEWVPSVQRCSIKVMLNDTVLHHGDIGGQTKLTHEFLDLDNGQYNLQIAIEEMVSWIKKAKIATLMIFLVGLLTSICMLIV